MLAAIYSGVSELRKQAELLGSKFQLQCLSADHLNESKLLLRLRELEHLDKVFGDLFES